MVLGVDAIDRLLELGRGLEAFVVAHDAVGGVGEPDAAIGMDHDVVGGIERLALELVGDHGDGAIVLIARHAPRAVLAGELPAFEIEGVAVAVAGGVAVDGDVAVLFEAAELAVVGDVAPEEEVALRVPGRPLRPARAGVEAFDGGAADFVFFEAGVEGDDIGVGVAERLMAGPVALGLRGGGGDGGGRGGEEGTAWKVHADILHCGGLGDEPAALFVLRYFAAGTKGSASLFE